MTDDKSTSRQDKAVRVRTVHSESRQTQEMASGRRSVGEGVGSSVPQDRIITLDALIPKLKNINGEVRPFAVFLGAGASYSAGIPLAGEIARLIEDKCKSEVKDCPNRDYATLMSKLVPSRRYELLKDYMDKAKLNVAHLYLAALVKAKYVDVVLTTNFDPLMIRALAHANIRPNVYDVPNTKRFDSMVIIPPAIVYLHGQFNSFITIHTIRESSEIQSDIKYAITSIIRNRTLVVIGYSGENDPVFDVMKAWPQYTHGLYWVHYNQDDPGRHVVQELLQDLHKYAYFIGDEPPDRFFPRLSTALGVETTHIANKPFTFLKEALDTLAPVQTEQGIEDFAKNVRDQVDNAIQCFELHKPCKHEKEKKERDRQRLGRAEVVKRAREAWMEGKHNEIGAIEKDARKIRSTEALVYVARMLNDKTRQGEGDETIPLFDEIVTRFGRSKAPGIKEQVAMALVNKGLTLWKLGRSEDEIKIYEEVVARFGRAKEPTILEQVVKALFFKGITLGKLGRSDDEIKIYDEVVARFGQSKKPAIQKQVAMALVNKGFRLGVLGRGDDGIKIYEEVVARFGQSKEPAIQKQVAMALFNKGVRLGVLGRSDDGIKIYDEIVARFSQAKESAILERVAMALFNKGVTLGVLGRSEDAIKIYEEVVARFEKATDPELIKLVDEARRSGAKLLKK